MARNRELILSFLAMILIGGIYAAVLLTRGAPESGRLLGHALGIVGFLLMLATETLYSLRKRAVRRARRKMSEWLQFHIFTGIVGPFLVLLHTAWAFRGLAGIVTLLMVIVVMSGFIGRYIYTAVPRTPEGMLVEADELQRLIRDAEEELGRVSGPEAPRVEPQGEAALILGRGPRDLAEWWRRRRALRRLDPAARESAGRVMHLQARLTELRRQAASLAAARRLLALWHTVHIPLGMALFVAAFYHVGAGLYYVTLQR
jgi:xanthosine utilization system XapX-like protein